MSENYTDVRLPNIFKRGSIRPVNTALPIQPSAKFDGRGHRF